MITKEDHINSSECEPLFGIHEKTEKLSKNLNFRENGKKKMFGITCSMQRTENKHY